MNVLILGDFHIDDKYIEEQKYIIDEILQYKADKVIQLGDYFNKNKLTPNEINFGMEVALRLKKRYNNVTILSGNGNHEWLNNVNIVSHLKNLDIEVVGREYKQEQYYFGHYMTNESNLEYGVPELKVSDLKQYKYAFLGHQHLTQDNKQFCHVGSIFWQHWNEVTDKYKRICRLNTDTENIEFIPLITPRPMVDVSSIKELAQIAIRNKVRIVWTSFAQFKKEIDLIPDWKDKFYEFQTKLAFTKEQNQLTIATNKDHVSLEHYLNEEVDKIEDKDVKELIVKILGVI